MPKINTTRKNFAVYRSTWTLFLNNSRYIELAVIWMIGEDDKNAL